MIDPKIRTLLMVDAMGSYTKAAQALSLTQPAVSHHIKLLEQELGVTIFYKKKTRLKPTPEGEILLQSARRAAALEDQMHQALEDNRRSLRTLTVGITPTAADILVPQILARYCATHPGVRFHIVTGPIKSINSMLRSYEVDFAIVDGVLRGEHYTSLLIDTDYLCLVVSPEHPFSRRKSISLEELMLEKLVIRPKKTGTRKLLEGYLISHGLNIADFNVIMEVDSVSTIKELVASNLGVTIISHSACEAEVHAGRLCVIPIENCRMVRDINLVYNEQCLCLDVIDDICRQYASLRQR